MNQAGRGMPWRPGASRHALERRARLLADIRAYFVAHSVLEVETPVLSASGNTDPNIRGMMTSDERRFLRTSPEYAMKRLLAAGLRDIYEMGRVFRGGEAGRHHNPEFTMVEWYRSGVSYLELASEVIDLVRQCAIGQFDGWAERRLTYRELFRETTGLDPFSCSEGDLETLALERGISAPTLSHAEWLDLVMAEVIQPALPGECLTVVHDFPPEQAALARVRPGDPPVAERFEVYLGQTELANGYQELTDADEQLLRFERERALRKKRGEHVPPLDTRLIDALRHGLPDCSGVALGVDRLLMAILKVDHIDAALAFSFERA